MDFPRLFGAYRSPWMNFEWQEVLMYGIIDQRALRSFGAYIDETGVRRKRKMPFVPIDYANMIAFNLTCTLVLELAAAFVLGLRGKKNFGIVFNVNCLTNPIVVTLLYLMIRLWGYGLLARGLLFLIEVAVVFAEGWIYKRHMPDVPVPPYRFSLVLNALSYGTGILLELLGI